MKRAVLLVVLGSGLLGLPGSLQAQGIWNPARLFAKKVPADPNGDYRLRAGHGPWMIMAATFSAAEESEMPAAEAQARELVLELRREHNLPAYIYHITFDHSKDVALDATRPTRRLRRVRYQRGMRTREIAVLVGNYPTVDHPRAQQDLKYIKYLYPKALSIPQLAKQGKKTYQQLAAYRMAQAQVDPEKLRQDLMSRLKLDGPLFVRNNRRVMGPMGSAFLTRNPLLPDEPIQEHLIDEFVYRLNKDVPHSLLKCPGVYTVRVATFSGASTVDPTKIKQVMEGKTQLKSRLVAAAEMAHRLTEALRAKGYDAYEFHDRYRSIVTVGSFQSVGRSLPDGKLELNPEILQVIRKFGATRGPDGKIVPRSLVGIPFDPYPIPIRVPRRSPALDYGRGT